MISYAQNGEDVLLKRVFPNTKGFYIDIGAAFPTLDSVTKHFYDLGWNGINVEPQPHIFKVLREQRPRDINLDCAVGTKVGTSKFTLFPDLWGWSTMNPEFSNPENVRKVEIDVQVKTFDSILEENKIEVPIDFVKIDVEGNEGDVLKSFNLRKWKPKVLIIEVITQAKDGDLKKAWERYITWRGYKFAVFDGLNRIYVRNDLKEMHKRLSSPVNCLDQYYPQRYLSLIPKDTRLARIADMKKNGRDISEFERFEQLDEEIVREANCRYEE